MTPLLTREELDRVAALASLELGDEEARALAGQLAAILAYARQIQEVDTTGVPPTTHVLAAQERLRNDEPAPSLEREAALANAPDADRGAGLFRVPRVIGG
jgi:aspartyl-tRNA(Asn)/glutamyl-tRNA(Gln) amidotransferase subunit C